MGGAAGVLGTRIKEGALLGLAKVRARGAEAHGSGQRPLACFVTRLPPCPREEPRRAALCPQR